MSHSGPLLTLAALLAGILNSIAGGGTFIIFPALLLSGVPPIMAKATTTLSLSPAYLTASFTNRANLRKVTQVPLLPCLGVSLLGGLLGAELLMHTPQARFVRLIPWLLLFASLIFTFGEKLSSSLKRYWRMPVWAVLLSFFLVAVYGSYFGGGIGIMLLAAMTLFGMGDLHAINSLKNLLAGCLDGVAMVLFALHQSVDWSVAWYMVLGSTMGGFLGAHYSKKVNSSFLRGFICAIGWFLTLYFFFKR